ncbi:sulfatase-like hydrolase/transferase [Parabacteroides sp. GYB001]|uniref:LTA synthase family protein n=1 Tax=Parabacteroides leei TaxID=2939491 RepID=UPI00201744D7|nr:alkaline phosphatase family protein [Parabacteroides leei]MCL3851301.1 sulfatase-like hydrolase/transferase [Parabacteroides leei]
MSKRLIFLLAVFALWLPVFAIQKPLFMLYHALENSSSLTDYLQVILHGVLLDCTISGYLTVIPLLCVLVSIWLPGTVYKKILKGYFLIIAILVAAIYAVDVALYGYWGFRLDATLFFYLQSPKDAMASVPLKTFALQLVMFAAYAWVIYWLFKRLIIPLFPSTPVRRRLGGTIGILLVGGILFIPIRGGITTSTANVGMVYFSKNQFLNHAAINPTFSLIASMSKQQDFAAQFNFFPEEERQERYATLTQYNDSLTNNAEKIKLLTTDRPNILIILLESFTANAIEAVGGEAGITPNLNKLSKEGITFTNMYANSFRTDRGLVAVLNGYLAQPTTSIMKYPAKSQTLPSIAKSLGEQGYTADMLYGGDINFTNMQSYFFGSGYSKITADRDFPLSSRLSKWGANDDITFSHLYESIRERDEKTPWLSTFLTLSSHEPFEVPFHHLEDPYLNSVAFTDSCIGSFVDKLKELPVWKNTLIVLISDHGYRYPSPMLDYEPRRFHIPMIWLGGAVKEPAIIDIYANQTDLAATLLSQLNLPHDQFTFSRDILDAGYPKYSFYTFSNGFGFIDSTGVSVYDNESNRPLQEEPSTDSQTRLDKGKVLLQTLYDDLGKR